VSVLCAGWVSGHLRHCHRPFPASTKPRSMTHETFSTSGRSKGRRCRRSAMRGLLAALLWLDDMVLAAAGAVGRAFVEGMIAYACGWYGLPPPTNDSPPSGRGDESGAFGRGEHFPRSLGGKQMVKSPCRRAA